MAEGPSHMAPAEAHPWATIWTNPRRTVHHVMATDPNQWLWVFIVSGGLSRVFARAAELPLEGAVPLFLLILAGPFAGAMVIFVIGRLLHWLLIRMGGRGSWIASRTAIAWAMAPSVPSLALWTIMLAAYGTEVLSPDAVDKVADPTQKLILSLDYFIQFLLTLWALMLEVVCLADVHKISIWRVLFAEIILGVALLMLVGGAMVLIR